MPAPNQLLRITKKEILADAVAVYRATCTDIDQLKLSSLEELSIEQKRLLTEYKRLREQTKIISRHIGEARNKGTPIDELKNSMKNYSASLKDVKNSIDNIESAILGYFDSSANPDKQPEKKTSTEYLRKYPCAKSTSATASIALLHNNDNEWNNYVTGNQDATIYHRAEWRHLIRDTYGHECYYFSARDSGRFTKKNEH